MGKSECKTFKNDCILHSDLVIIEIDSEIEMLAKISHERNCIQSVGLSKAKFDLVGWSQTLRPPHQHIVKLEVTAISNNIKRKHSKCEKLIERKNLKQPKIQRKREKIKGKKRRKGRENDKQRKRAREQE